MSLKQVIESATFEFFVRNGKLYVEYNGRPAVRLSKLLKGKSGGDVRAILYDLWKWLRIRRWNEIKDYPRQWEKAIVQYIMDKFPKEEYPLDIMYYGPKDIKVNIEESIVFRNKKDITDFLDSLGMQVPPPTLIVHNVGIKMTEIDFEDFVDIQRRGNELRVKGTIGGRKVKLNFVVVRIDVDAKKGIYNLIGPGGSVLVISDVPEGFYEYEIG